MQLCHSESGKTNRVTFYVDDAWKTMPEIIDPFISTTSFQQEPSDGKHRKLRYISGVPTFISGDLISVQVTCKNCVGLFYNANYVAKIHGPGISTSKAHPTGEYRNQNSTPLMSIVTTVSDEPYYSEDFSANITIQDSASTKNTGVAKCLGNKILRIDTVSLQHQGLNPEDYIKHKNDTYMQSEYKFIPEKYRIDSKFGKYPKINYNKQFNPIASLRSNYELQLINLSLIHI